MSQLFHRETMLALSVEQALLLDVLTMSCTTVSSSAGPEPNWLRVVCTRSELSDTECHPGYSAPFGETVLW